MYYITAPVLDLSRELRWGRVEENYGEDPYLTGENMLRRALLLLLLLYIC